MQDFSCKCYCFLHLMLSLTRIWLKSVCADDLTLIFFFFFFVTILRKIHIYIESKQSLVEKRQVKIIMALIKWGIVAFRFTLFYVHFKLSGSQNYSFWKNQVCLQRCQNDSSEFDVTCIVAVCQPMAILILYLNLGFCFFSLWNCFCSKLIILWKIYPVFLFK